MTAQTNGNVQLGYNSTNTNLTRVYISTWKQTSHKKPDTLYPIFKRLNCTSRVQLKGALL